MSNTDVETLSDSHLMLDDPIEIPRKPLINLPADWRSYRGSSHSEEFLTGWEELEENDRDHDYVMPSDNELSEDSQASHDQSLPRKTGPQTKAKFKPQKLKVSFFVLRIETSSELMDCVVYSEAISGLQ